MTAKILWLIKGLGLGGAERLLTLSAPHLDRTRFEYEAAFLLPWKTALVRELECAGIRTTCLNHRHALDVRIVPRLARFLRERHVDILHLHLPYTGVIGRLAAQLAGVPHVVYTEHNVQGCYHPISRAANQATMRLCDLTIAVSEEVRVSLLRSPLARGIRVRVIPNGVDAEGVQRASLGPSITHELGIPDDRLIVGMAGMFRTEKRLDLWIRAARMIADAEPKTVFILVGDGPERQRLEALTHDLGLSGDVIFTGLRQDAPRLLARFDVFMLSSIHEGLPVAVLESMALGRPVVATRVGGLPGVLEDGRHGFLVPPGDPAILAERVLVLLRNHTLREHAGAAARIRVRERFSIQQMVQSVEHAYSEVLENSPGSVRTEAAG